MPRSRPRPKVNIPSEETVAITNEDLLAKIRVIEEILDNEGDLFAKIRGIEEAFLRLNIRIRDLENERLLQRSTAAAAALRRMEAADDEGSDVITMRAAPEVEGSDVKRDAETAEGERRNFGGFGLLDKIFETAAAKAKRKSKKRKKSTKRKKKQTKRKKR
jgi:hypothetical protein